MQPRRRPRRSTLSITLLLVAPVLACAGDTDSPASTNDANEWVGSEERIGDTVIVTTESGQVWPGPPRLVEELRIGALDGPNEYQFGMITDLTVDEQGGIYAFDGHVPALRYYSAEGEYLRKLGRQGSGPGEYEDACLGLVIDSTGRILMRDPRNGRINRYSASGEAAGGWPVASGLFTSDATILDDRDHLFLRILTGPIERNKPWPIGLLHLDDTGAIVDTLLPPTFADEPDGSGIFMPSKVWTYSPLGYFVVGINDRYAIDLRPGEGEVTRIVRVTDPTPVLPDERSEWQAYYDWMIENRGDSFTLDEVSVPGVKPFFSGFLIGDDGRIWVERYGLAEKVEDPPASDDGRPTISWRAPAHYDVFEADGRFLGTVRMPGRTRIDFARGNYVWGIASGEFDEPYVVRWRLDFGA